MIGVKGQKMSTRLLKNCVMFGRLEHNEAEKRRYIGGQTADCVLDGL